MKELKYIDNIFNDYDDFEGGLLNSLKAEPSVDIHDVVMRKINASERKLMKRFNYKKYLSVAAAVVIFISGLGRMAYVGLQRDKEINVATTSEIKSKTEVKTENNKITASIENIKTEQKNVSPKVNTDNKISNKTSMKSTKQNTNQSPKSTETEKTLNTVATVAKEDKVNSIEQHNDNIYSTLSESSISYEYEVYLTDADKNVLDYINANALWITDELYSFDAVKFEEFKKYAEENKIEIQNVNLDKQNYISNEIIIRLIKK